MSLDSKWSGKLRKNKRKTLTAEVGVRRSVHRGVQSRFVELPRLGEQHWIKFDGLESLEATVRWLDGHVGGVHFERPLQDRCSST